MKHHDGSEDEWSQLVAVAGQPQYGYVLEADISPVTPNAVHLVASLVGVGPFNTDITPFHAGVGTEYRVLVRDSTGKPIELNKSARKASLADKRVCRGGYGT